MSEICINDEILKCKYVNGPVKSDIALHKKKTIITKTQMKTDTIYRPLQCTIVKHLKVILLKPLIHQIIMT